jgi:hypothetical protein
MNFKKQMQNAYRTHMITTDYIIDMQQYFFYGIQIKKSCQSNRTPAPTPAPRQQLNLSRKPNKLYKRG